MDIYADHYVCIVAKVVHKVGGNMDTLPLHSEFLEGSGHWSSLQEAVGVVLRIEFYKKSEFLRIHSLEVELQYYKCHYV